MASSRNFILLTAKLAALVVFAGVSGLLAQDGRANGTNLSEVVTSNNRFAVDLYRNINAHETGKNIFVSPYSISAALAMTYLGSSGNTQKQMATTLHFTLPKEKLEAGFSELLGQTKSTPAKHYKLNVANALWGQAGFHFEPAFTSGISKYFDGGFNVVNYIEDDEREASRAKINGWVEEKTAHKIKNLVHKDDINNLTRLILTNAIYFKGDWASKFKVEKTRNESFTVSPGITVTVPMMEQTGNFPFMENDELKMIELPYTGDDLSTIVILPKGNVETFGATLSLAKLQEFRGFMSTHQVKLSLPRFKFETRYLLKEPLTAMGMPDAFKLESADFSGMTGKPYLYITSVIHQAMIDVNEEGSEAAAATAVIMGAKSIRIPTVFRADRPFLFMIIHKPTDSILFMGRVSNPPPSATAGTAGK
jgi:serpin B